MTTKKKVSKKRGPKPIDINWEQVDKLAFIHCTLEEIVSVLGISKDTLRRACKRELKKDIATYIKEKSTGGKASLRRRQYQKAMDGNTAMLIWLGKQWLHQTDKIQHAGSQDEPIKLAYEPLKILQPRKLKEKESD